MQRSGGCVMGQAAVTAYVVFQRDSTEDAAALARYSRIAGATFDGHDVQVLVGYGPHEVLEGPPLEGVVVLAFPTAAAAKDWYFGDAYQEAARHRFEGATYRAVLVEGTDQQ